MGWSIRGPPDLDGGGGGEGPLHPFVRPRRALGRSQSQQARDDARPSFRGNFLGTLCYRTNPPFTLQRISCIDPSTNTRFSVAPPRLLLSDDKSYAVNFPPGGMHGSSRPHGPAPSTGTRPGAAGTIYNSTMEGVVCRDENGAKMIRSRAPPPPQANRDRLPRSRPGGHPGGQEQSRFGPGKVQKQDIMFSV